MKKGFPLFLVMCLSEEEKERRKIELVSQEITEVQRKLLKLFSPWSTLSNCCLNTWWSILFVDVVVVAVVEVSIVVDG